jgi:uncharacterized membrane protein SpoIIM required for sporulation
MALVVSDVILVRMGIRIFHREELLGREIDSLDLRRSWRLFKGYLLDPPILGFSSGDEQIPPATGNKKLSRLTRIYRLDVPRLLRTNRPSLGVVLIGLGAAALIGWVFAVQYPLPAGVINLESITGEAFYKFEGSGFLPPLSTWGIFSHNVRSLLAAALLAILSFGSLAIVLLMAPVAIIGFAAVQVASAGYDPWTFIGVFILPHGILELPAAILATATAVRLGISVVAPPQGMTVSQSWLQALAHFLKLFLLVVLPMLAVAAFIEANITPELVVAVYGN